jgi:hypothetical protein
LAPIGLVYLGVQHEHGFERDIKDNIVYSAHLDSYARVWHGMSTWTFLPRETTAVRALFPGFTLLALAVCGAQSMRRRVIERVTWTRSLVVLYITLTLVSLVLSLGPVPMAFGRPILPSGPYAWLMFLVPGLDGLRIPARLGTVTMLGLSVLGSLGAARLLSAAERRSWRVPLAVAIGLAVVAEGYGGPVPLADFDPLGRPEDRQTYEWLSEGPEGAVLKLPIMEDRRRQKSHAGFSLDHLYQYATLQHGRPLINGAPEFSPALVRFLGGSASPLREPALTTAVTDMLRALGARYVVLHRHDFAVSDEAEQVISRFAASGRNQDTRDFGPAVVFRLEPVTPTPRVDTAGLTPLASGARSITSSHARERLGQLVDGNHDNRWISGTRQTGDEWIEIELREPATVRVLQLMMAERSLGDYPRKLMVESIGPAGDVRQVFHGSVLPHLALGLVRNGSHPTIDLQLEPNMTRTLRLRQTGTTRTFNWSIHELEVWGMTVS